MNSSKKQTWPERERRTCPNNGACLDHAGILERVYMLQKKTDEFDRKNFVPFANYKWSIGIIISTLISLFSISIYLALDTKREISSISANQETTIYKISDIQKDIEDLKEVTDELKKISVKIHNHQ